MDASRPTPSHTCPQNCPQRLKRLQFSVTPMQAYSLDAEAARRGISRDQILRERLAEWLDTLVDREEAHRATAGN